MSAARPLRVIFAGTPEFARVALAQIHQHGHTVSLVLTQPDRPAGRGMHLQASAVKQYALAHGLPLAQPRSLRLDGAYPEDATQARAAMAAAAADVMVVAAYGLILPQWVLDAMAPGWGCLNIHGSLLPRWRGAAPIHRAIEAGDAETGVTIMQMDAGLDTGDMLLMERLAIGPTDTTGLLHDRIADLGARCIVDALAALPGGQLQRQPQPAEGITYAHKIGRQEAQIDWQQDAAQISRRVRAFDPFPGAVTSVGGETIKVWRAEVAPSGMELPANAASAAPGTVLAATPAGIAVVTGQGVLLLQTLQKAGGKRLDAADFLRGFPLAAGVRLD